MEISLDKYFLEAFGYSSEAFKPNVRPASGDVINKRTEYGTVANSPYYAKDWAGREYYLPIKVFVGRSLIPNTSTTYAEDFGTELNDGRDAGWLLPYPVMSIKSKKRIIDTPLTERDGPVSELINIEGWIITVRGFLVNMDANEVPEDDFKTLVKLYSYNIPIKIKNPLTDILLIKAGSKQPQSVTMRNLDFPERPGVKHVKPYQFEFWSNEDYNLIDIS